MTNKIVIFALAQFHTVLSIVIIWANLAALMTKPSRLTVTNSIKRTTSSIILAFTYIGTICSVGSILTWFRTLWTLPTRETLALTSYMMTISIFTITRVLAIWTIGIIWARVLAHRSNITWPARKFSCYMITRHIFT